MADTVTSNYGWVKPEVSASNDTWGTKLNADLDSIDSKIKSLDTLTAAAKATPISADFIGVFDSAAANVIKKTTLGQLAAVLPAMFTTVPLANGGTGGTSASTARTNLGLGSAAVQNESYFALATRTLTAGNGLSGGGDLSANRSFALDFSELINYGAFDLTAKWGISGNVRVIMFNTDGDEHARLTPDAFRQVVSVPSDATFFTAGEGLTGGGSLAADRTIDMGTPSSVTTSSTNSTTAGSHTHAIGFTPALFKTGTGTDDTDLPVGSIVLADRNAQSVPRNGDPGAALRLGPGTNDYMIGGSGTVMSGTWRCRGTDTDIVLVQRVA